MPEYMTFFKRFEKFKGQYVIIGGSAAAILLEQNSFDFRLTQDYDMVVLFEKTNDDFSKAFHDFCNDFGYVMSGRKELNGSAHYYRFTLNENMNSNLPKMIELFSKVPAGYYLEAQNGITPLHYDDITSLSAIILDDDYYDLLRKGVLMVNGNEPILRVEYLILFKIKAHLDKMDAVSRGEKVQHADKSKHFNDILKLMIIVSEADHLPLSTLPYKIRQDVLGFLELLNKMQKDNTLHAKLNDIKLSNNKLMIFYDNNSANVILRFKQIFVM